MTLYRIEIDRSTCVGYGGCVREAPDVFWLEDEVAYAEDTTGDAQAVEAAELCPVSAITIVPVPSDTLAA